MDSSEYVIFKDNEIFFGNSGGAMVNCNGNLVGVVSMMSNFQNSMLKLCPKQKYLLIRHARRESVIPAQAGIQFRM